ATIMLADGRTIDTRKGTVPRDGRFQCQACGQEAEVLAAAESRQHAPSAVPFMIQGFDNHIDSEGSPYGGKFFKCYERSDVDRLIASERQWASSRQTELANFWPTSEVPYGNRTHIRDPITRHGYTHWYKMFFGRQLLMHASLLQ